MKEPEKFPYHFLETMPWHHEMPSLWLASTLTLRRNFSRYPFPHKQTKAQAEYIAETLQEALLKSSLLKNPICLDYGSLSSVQKDFLLERFFISEGVFEEKPHQKLISDASGSFLAAINFSDHLLLHSIDCDSDWHPLWEILNGLEHTLAENIDYAFSQKFGYLTSNIQDCGTGLRVEAYLHLPGLLHKMSSKDSLSAYEEEGILLSYLQPSEKEATFQGDFVRLRNKYCLGVPEDALLRQLYSNAERLMNAEKDYRLTLKTSSSSDVKDKVCRAFGTLLHSYQLSTQETLSALSLIKLGLDMGWISGMSDAHINTLFLTCRRGHLLLKQSKETSQEELLHLRAHSIHEQFKDVKLLIE